MDCDAGGIDTVIPNLDRTLDEVVIGACIHRVIDVSEQDCSIGVSLGEAHFHGAPVGGELM